MAHTATSTCAAVSRILLSPTSSATSDSGGNRTMLTETGGSNNDTQRETRDTCDEPIAVACDDLMSQGSANASRGGTGSTTSAISGPESCNAPVCALCLDPACDPLTTPCGHVFCSGRTGECEGLRKMAALTHPEQTTASCPMCRGDILQLLTDNFPDELHLRPDDPGESLAALRDLIVSYLGPMVQGSWRVSGVVGDRQWRDLLFGEVALGRTPPRLSRLGTYPGDRYVFHRHPLMQMVPGGWEMHIGSGSGLRGSFNLASRVGERFHPVYGEWREELAPTGAFYDAAFRHHPRREWIPVPSRRQSHDRTAAPTERRRRVLYSFALDDVLQELAEPPCFVGQVLRRAAVHFIYNADWNRLVYSHSDCAEYSRQQLRPLHQHPYNVHRTTGHVLGLTRN